MEENNLQMSETEDTNLENTYEETTDIEFDDEQTVTPNGDDIINEDDACDTEVLAQDTVSEKADVTEPFISVQYNHKTKDFTKEEAVNLIQKGMHTESLRTKLEYLADSYGLDINTLVEAMVSLPDDKYQQHLEKLYGRGSVNVGIGMQIYREKQSDAYKKMLASHENERLSKIRDKEVENVNSRLANQYLALKSEIPNAPDYAKLPDSVIIEAANGGKDLLSAYLCYENRENLKIEAAKTIQKAASNASSKSMKSTDSENVNSQERSFLSGLWSK